ncbi:tetratricopeptide repeat protein [candidate division GN15 bacterium]|nr:tetratricopeptide repeat protein [candidate division GN15 bacterium]
MSSAPQQNTAPDPPGDPSPLLRPLSWLSVILGVALVLRLVYLIVYSGMPDWEQLTVDNYYHHHWAQIIADGDLVGDTTYFRAPFYVWCLGLLYALFGNSLWVGRLFGLAIGLATVAMSYQLGKRVSSTKVGLIAAALAAVYPVQLYFESELLLDPLFSLLMLAAVERTLRWFQDGRIITALTGGILLGLAVLTRPTGLVMVPIIVILTLWPERRTKHLQRGLVILLLPVVVLVGAVFLRNVVVADDPVLIASQGGINLYIGNNKTADGLSATLPEPLGHNWQIAQVTHIAENDIGYELTPGEVSDYWQDRAADWIKANPGEFLQLYARKLAWFTGDREISNNRALVPFFTDHSLLKANPLSFAWLLATTLIALLFRWRLRVEYLLPLLTIAIYIAVMALFFYNSRFRLPLLPYFYLFAAIGIVVLVEVMVKRSRRLWFIIPTSIAVLVIAYIPRPGLIPHPAVQPLVSEGLHYQAHGDYRQALELFERARAADSTFPEVHLNIGVCLLRLGETNRAEDLFRHEIALHPQRYKAYTNLASIALLNDRPDSALAYATTAVDLAPRDITANRAWLRAITRSSPRQNRVLQTAANRALSRTDGSIYIALEGGLIALSRSQPDAASKLLALATELNRPPIETDDAAFGPQWINSPRAWRLQRAQAYYRLGYLAGSQGQVDRAIEMSQQAIAHDSTLAEAWVNLISGHATRGELSTVDSLLSLAGNRFPNNELIQSLRNRR